MPKPTRPTEDSQSWQVLANFGKTGAQGVEYWSVEGRDGESWRGRAGARVLSSDVITVLPLPFHVSLGGGVVFEARATELRGGSAGIQNKLVGHVWRGGGGELVGYQVVSGIDV